jgi:hypothetical protein
LVPAFPGVGLAWDTNTLAADGVLRVAAGDPFTYPTNITATLAGSTLQLSWPADHLGWLLQATTNSLGVNKPTNNWFTITSSSATNQVLITINPAGSPVFYRMIAP